MKITQKFLESLGFRHDGSSLLRWRTVQSEPDGDFSGQFLAFVNIDGNRWGAEMYACDKSPCDGIGFGEFTTQQEIRVLCVLIGVNACPD